MQTTKIAFQFLVLCIFVFFTTSCSHAENIITGTFPSLAGKEIRLEGFRGLDTYVIDRTQVDEKGKFTLSFEDKDKGMGYLVAGEERPFIVVLSDETLA